MRLLTARTMEFDVNLVDAVNLGHNNQIELLGLGSLYLKFWYSAIKNVSL
jgi:hypothetical protein